MQCPTDYVRVSLDFPELLRLHDQLSFISNEDYPVDKEDGTQDMEQRAQWSAPARAAYCTLYSISCVQSSFLSTRYRFLTPLSIQVHSTNALLHNEIIMFPD